LSVQNNAYVIRKCIISDLLVINDAKWQQSEMLTSDLLVNSDT